MDRISKIEQKLAEIDERNKRVEADKAWETSGFRKILIFVITYTIAAIWLYFIENSRPLLNAFVPALGWYLSTLTVPIIKRNWIKNKK